MTGSDGRRVRDDPQVFAGDKVIDRAKFETWQRRLSDIAGAPVGEPNLHMKGPEAAAAYRVTDLAITDDPDDFEFYMHVRDLGMISAVYTAIRTSVSAAATPDAFRRNTEPSEFLAISTPLSRPAYWIDAGGRRLLTRPGDLSVTRDAITVQYSDTATEWAGIVISRSLLGQRRAAVIDHSWIPVVSGSLLARATASFVTSFAVTTAAGIGPEPSTDTQLAAVDLIGTALSEMAGVSSSLTDNPAFVQEAVLDLIERRHGDPDFGVDDIARELHLSRRQVYRYFEDTEQSLAGRIARRRVITATQLLRAEPRAAIGNVGRRSGFGSVATFRNRFRALVGIGPTEYRAMVLSGETLPEVAAVG